MRQLSRRATATQERPPARISAGLRVVLLLAAGLSAGAGQWLTSAATAGILLVTLMPRLLSRRLRIYIPPDLEMLAVVFAFGTLFLGEVHGYYVRFPWWDVVLHLQSGLQLSVLGFLLVYVLNHDQVAGLGLKPAFVAIFAFTFSVALGALWEIFEFAMDQIFGLNMQKSGLVDTMWDLIVDTLGAAVVALVGYDRLKTLEVNSLLEQTLNKFLGHQLPAATRPGRLTRASGPAVMRLASKIHASDR